MKNTRTLGKLGAGIAAVSLGLLGVGITATPATAASDTVDITTSNFEFNGVDTYSGYIEDVNSYDPNTGIYGWTDDAFDGFPQNFSLSVGDSNSWSFYADTSVPTIVDGGLSSIVMTGTTGDFFGADVYTVVLTLTLEGNYARWSYAINGADTSDVTVTMNGELGSDSDSEYTISGNTMLSSDSRDAGEDDEDPIIGWSVDTNGVFGGFDVDPTNPELADRVSVSATGASKFTLTTVFQDYEATAGDEAKSFVASLLPTLGQTFGASYPLTRAPLLTLEPLKLTKGVAVNTTLAGTISDVLAAGEDNYFEDGYFGDTAGEVGAIFTNVPAGLTLTFSQDADLLPVFTLTGTPTESGDFAADVTLYRLAGGDEERAIAPDDSIGRYPISATAAITVPAVVTPAAPTTTAPAPKASLAATGFDGMILVGFGGLAAAAGILLVAATRRRRA